MIFFQCLFDIIFAIKMFLVIENGMNTNIFILSLYNTFFYYSSQQSNGSNDVVEDLFPQKTTNGHGPLGINLNKTPSAFDSIQQNLAPTSKVKTKESTCAIHTRTTAVQGMKPSKKLRAPSFQASILRIGDWEVKKISTRVLFLLMYSI